VQACDSLRIEACAVYLAQDQRMTQQLHGCIADLLLVAVRRSALLLDEARAVLIPVELNNGLVDDQHGSRASWSGFCMCRAST
jgi:hypothetical protein